MKHNFSAGPAILPKVVFQKASDAVLDYQNIGLSLLEISHRSPEFVDIMKNCSSLIKEILNVPDDYEILYLTGGASSQFYMTALNILGNNQRAGYINTGTWSTKAIKEAKLYGIVDELASSKDSNFNYIPKEVEIPEGLRYVHYTSNNTIFGTQFHELPNTDTRLVCDMSSDIFSRPVDVSRFDIIYAGAQKNIGPAGVTLVIIKKDIVDQIERDIPTMLNYKTHIEKGSAFNTPPVFPIYCCMLTLEWISEQGGLEEIEKLNKEKASLLYDEIDRNTCFKGTAEVGSRSLMNVCFLLNNEELNDSFLEMATNAGCVGIKGHRSVGGFRASIYNAMPKSSIEKLIEVMQAFESKYA